MREGPQPSARHRAQNKKLLGAAWRPGVIIPAGPGAYEANSIAFRLSPFL